MPKLVAIQASHGEIRIAVPKTGEGITAVGVLDDAVESVRGSLDEAFATASSMGDAFASALKKATSQPSAAELEFGLQFTAKGTVYVVGAEATASIKVKVTYKLS
jgi:hypothetical protein